MPEYLALWFMAMITRVTGQQTDLLCVFFKMLRLMPSVGMTSQAPAMRGAVDLGTQAMRDQLMPKTNANGE
jgi:hypothetical protein